MSKQNFDSEELVKLFHKIHQRLDWLTCAIKECCSKIPINIGDGIGLFKRLANNKWEFKSLVEGDNITITETTEEIIISSQATPFSCEDVNECLGISDIGESNKFLNEQGDFVTVSGFTCSDLDSCSTSNLQEGSRLYFTNGRAVTALTGQNISLFTNNSGFITSSALSPYLTITSAASTYQPIGSYLTSISGLNISQLNNDSGYITEAIADTKYYSITNPNSFITSSALTPYLLSSTASSTYEPIITPGTISQYYRGDKTFQTLDKSTVGLGNVDNTSDSSKPISTATQTALDLKANKSEVVVLVNKISTTYTVTGTTSETPFTSLMIPANTFSSGDRVTLDAMFLKTGGAGTTVSSFRISTSDSVSPITNATLMAKTPTAIAATTIYPLIRNYIKIDSPTSTIMPPASGGAYNDFISFNSLPITNLNIDWTVDQYIYPTETLGNSADAVTLKYFAIYKG
jgi:hypothetical protein